MMRWPLREIPPSGGAYYHEILGHQLRELIPEGKRILDLGCGQGDRLAALRPSDGLGVDLSPVMIGRARRRHPHLRFAVADAEDLSLQEGPFDVILLSNTIGALQDIQAALHRLRGYCMPDTGSLSRTTTSSGSPCSRPLNGWG